MTTPSSETSAAKSSEYSFIYSLLLGAGERRKGEIPAHPGHSSRQTEALPPTATYVPGKGNMECHMLARRMSTWKQLTRISQTSSTGLLHAPAFCEAEQ
jgi:hypothetical protein